MLPSKVARCQLGPIDLRRFADLRHRRDIDLERRRISLSLRQANDDVDDVDDSFDASLYGMKQYDEQGNYIYPEGFDPETNEWLPGHEEQQAAWERQYAEAQARFMAHKKQKEAAKAASAEQPAE